MNDSQREITDIPLLIYYRRGNLTRLVDVCQKTFSHLIYPILVIANYYAAYHSAATSAEQNSEAFKGFLSSKWLMVLNVLTACVTAIFNGFPVKKLIDWLSLNICPETTKEIGALVGEINDDDFTPMIQRILPGASMDLDMRATSINRASNGKMILCCGCRSFATVVCGSLALGPYMVTAGRDQDTFIALYPDTPERFYFIYFSTLAYNFSLNIWFLFHAMKGLPDQFRENLFKVVVALCIGFVAAWPYVDMVTKDPVIDSLFHNNNTNCAIVTYLYELPEDEKRDLNDAIIIGTVLTNAAINIAGIRIIIDLFCDKGAGPVKKSKTDAQQELARYIKTNSLFCEMSFDLRTNRDTHDASLIIGGLLEKAVGNLHVLASIKKCIQGIGALIGFISLTGFWGVSWNTFYDGWYPPTQNTSLMYLVKNKTDSKGINGTELFNGGMGFIGVTILFFLILTTIFNLSDNLVMFSVAKLYQLCPKFKDFYTRSRLSAPKRSCCQRIFSRSEGLVTSANQYGPATE